MLVDTTAIAIKASVATGIVGSPQQRNGITSEFLLFMSLRRRVNPETLSKFKP